MSFSVSYHPLIKTDDLPRINPDMQKRIRNAIENRLKVAPHEYGEPLRKTLKGYWKLRVGDYRVVFRILEETVYIYCICHRKDVYQEALKRS